MILKNKTIIFYPVIFSQQVYWLQSVSYSSALLFFILVSVPCLKFCLDFLFFIVKVYTHKKKSLLQKRSSTALYIFFELPTTWKRLVVFFFLLVIIKEKHLTHVTDETYYCEVGWHKQNIYESLIFWCSWRANNSRAH